MPSPSTSHTKRARWPIRAAILVLIAAVVVLCASLAFRTHASPHRVESMFQDDQYLLYEPTATVVKTLETLSALGVDRVRVQVLWSVIAPNPGAARRPPHFDATNPADYPLAGWYPYDRLVELARAHGIALNFNLTAPGPLWAMAPGALSTRLANHYRPSAKDFGRFVVAVGKRYSGSYEPPTGTGARPGPLPRVSYWSVWNEPNQPGWLAPQWRLVRGQKVMNSPRLYRQYADAAFTALRRTGHRPSSDTILIGELAPEGSEANGANDPLPPMPFLRSLYCVDASYRPIRGALTGVLHCPSGGDPEAFVKANPALFAATGFAHHPYAFFLAPGAHMADPNFVPLADLSRLERGLDRIFAAYGINRQLPIYLTEYGYETNPPNPYRGFSPRRQALFLNQAQYMAWQDPRVRTLSQFLLYDSLPDRSFRPTDPRYWSTFQTGLLYANGVHKPSLNAYRLPIFLPSTAFAPGQPVLVWGMLRLAPNYAAQSAQIQWRGLHGRYRTLTTFRTSDPSGFLSIRLQLPGTGAVRIAWVSPAGQLFHSRAVGVRSG